MLDKYNRNIDYVRLSVIDSCNFNCKYCRPSGDEIENSKNQLSDEEILNIIENLAKIGIKKVKITGGEPLLRQNLMNLIREIKKINGISQVTLTTNGLLLDKFANELLKIGIDGVNISLDSINHAKFYEISGVNKCEKVLENIKNAQEMGIKNIKINCVLLDESYDYIGLIKWSHQQKIDIKFIELMPIGLGKEMSGISLEKFQNMLKTNFGTLEKFENNKNNGPADFYKIKDLDCNIGLIAAVSNKFCENCNKIRITSDGKLKTCLHFSSEVDLKQYIFEESLIEVLKNIIYEKKFEHNFLDENSNGEVKFMYQIGG